LVGNFWHFITGASMTGIGAIVFAVLMNAIFGEKYARDMGAALDDNGSRMVTGAFSVVCMYVGARVIQTVAHPERWNAVVEIGWALLTTTTVCSAVFFRRSLLSKNILAVSLLGLFAMAVVTIGSG
jgi:hypothetical protein